MERNQPTTPQGPSQVRDFQPIAGICAVGYVRNLYLTAFWNEVTAPALEQIRQHRLGFLQRTEGPLLALQMVLQIKVRMISKEARKLVEAINADGRSRFVAEGYYVRAGGMVVSTVRFVAGGVQLVNKTGWPIEVFGDVHAAARWLSTHSSTPALDLTSGIKEFEARCEPLMVAT